MSRPRVCLERAVDTGRLIRRSSARSVFSLSAIGHVRYRLTPPADVQRNIESRQDALADANEQIGNLAWSSDPTGALLWTFWCECGQPDCLTHVELPLERYEGLRRVDRYPLARGHAPAQARATRRKASGLREEARALRNEARQTLSRTEAITEALGSMRELMCAVCGYGVCARSEPPACPICQSSEWLARAIPR